MRFPICDAREPATPPTALPLPENSASRARTSARRSPRYICWPKAAATPSSRWAPPRPRALLESILFFAHDSELVGRVFESACEFVSRVPVFRLTFFPDARVWELIQ